MNKVRKNFLSYSVPSADTKKATAKKILSDLMESLSVEELNKLYQNSEVPKSISTVPTQLPLDTAMLATNLEPVSDTLATVSQIPSEDKLVIGLKKPLKVVFKDDSHIQETPSVTESMEYDFLESAPPLDLSSDRQEAFNSAIPMRRASSSAIVEMHSGKNIKSIEEDLEGLSVVGLDNDIGMNLLM